MRVTLLAFLFLAATNLPAQTSVSPDHGRPATGTAKPSPPATKASEVRVTGSLSAAVVAKGAQFSGFVTIGNDTPQTLSGMRIIIYVPDGFSFRDARAERNPPSALKCAADNPAAPSILACDVVEALPPGAERAFTLSWQADSDEPEHSMDITVEWLSGSVPSSAPPSSRALSLGQISSEDSWKLYVARNPLILPLITGVLGGLIVALAQALLSAQEKRKEDERARLAKIEEERRAGAAKIEEEKRAAATRKLEEERAHKIATWDMMLPQAHELAMRHYVLMQAFVRGAISSLDRYDRASEPGGTPDPELDDLPARAFLCLVMFARRMQYSTDTVGGLYFKNRIAEEIVSRCYYSYRKLYYDRDIKERARYESILNRVSADARVSQLYDALHGHASSDHTGTKLTKKAAAALHRDLKTAFEEFEELWIKNNQRQKILPILKAFAAVMQFEMNRPYRYWYNEKAKLEISDEAREAVETLGETEPFGMNNNWNLFRTSAKAYMQVARQSGTDEPDPA